MTCSLNDFSGKNFITLFKEMLMKKLVLLSLVLAISGVAGAAAIPVGCTGLWLFDNSANVAQATIGTDLTTNAVYTAGLGGGALSTTYGTWATNTGGMTANGGGAYVNEYTIGMDIYLPAPGEWRSLLQTANTPTKNDADMWVSSAGEVGLGASYSAAGAIPTGTWCRVVMAADLGNYFKIYVNGTEVVSLTNDIGLDGRLSLYDYSVSFFSDDNGEDGPVICNTLAYWNRTLSGAEIASMANAYTVLEIPEPMTLGLIGIGSLFCARRKK
jgi:hypothetical protein